uniref:Mediator of RNA polymerase II transcription subunit 13 n=1 Tax=Anopheles coluzzii TaxID=1518534 RepID=A0A8W7Q557_ANOCL
MTHQNHQTNGASLEDCHTNFFALTDLCGIRWRQLVLGERPNAAGDPLDDPVVRSYSKCLAVDILCVWRRVVAPKPKPKPEPDPSSMFDMSIPGTGNSGSVVHPPLSLTAAKELWIFWYGEEPDLTDLVAPELLNSSEAGDKGSWENGLSYECRSLLFKALHNVIERCLLSRGFVRIEQWFVHPTSNDERVFGKSSHHASFSFTFFVHGDSTVITAMDIREHPPVRLLTMKHLEEAQRAAAPGAAAAAAAAASTTGGPASPDGGLNGAPGCAPGSPGGSSNSAVVPADDAIEPREVLLAPFAITGTLTGQSYRASDPHTQKILDDWSAFYPITNKHSGLADGADSMPPLVEVLVGKMKMRYPSKYVLVPDMDDWTTTTSNTINTTSNQTAGSSSSNAAAAASSARPKDTANDAAAPSPTGTLRQRNHHKSMMTPPLTVPESPSNDLGNPLSMSSALINKSPAVILPERVWQDCIMHASTPAATAASSAGSGTTATTQTSAPGSVTIKTEPKDNTSGSNSSTNNNNNNNSSNSSSGGGDENSSGAANGVDANGNSSVWEISDPTVKVSCCCIKCCKRPPSSSSSSSSSSASSSASGRTQQQQQQHTIGAAGSSSANATGGSNYASISSPGGGGAAAAGGGGSLHPHPKSSYSITYPGSSSGSSRSSHYHHHQSTKDHHHHHHHHHHRPQRVAFHKRPPQEALFRPGTEPLSLSAAAALAAAAAAAAANAASSPGAVSSGDSAADSLELADTCLRSNQNCAASSGGGGGNSGASNTTGAAPGSTTPYGGPPSYCRNPMSIGDSHPLPSEGSPASAAPSPMQPSSVSQPTSVPSGDQLITMSPHPPASNNPRSVQPGTPCLDHLDKNTPAPTPTDQHDSKSINASPYHTPSHPGGGGGGSSGGTTEGGQQQQASANLMGNSSSSSSSNSSSNGSNSSSNSSNSLSALKASPRSSLSSSGIGSLKVRSESSLGAGGSCSLGSGGGGGVPMTPSIHSVFSSAHQTAMANNLASKRESILQMLQSLKRPSLFCKDYETLQGEDIPSTSQLLYDYTCVDAWMNHPVKRMRLAAEENRLVKKIRNLDLYANEHSRTMASGPGLAGSGNSTNGGIGTNGMLMKGAAEASEALAEALSGGRSGTGGGSDNGAPNNGAGCTPLLGQIKMEIGCDGSQAGAAVGSANGGTPDRNGASAGNGGAGDGALLGEHEIKKEKEDKGSIFLTDQDLQPSIDDLNQIFDDGGPFNDDPDLHNTPPGSNKSSSGSGGFSEESKRFPSSNHHSVNSGMLSPKELSQMFPTPPSLDPQHPSSSPGGGGCLSDGGSIALDTLVDLQMSLSSGAGSGGGNGGGASSVPPIPNLGSPQEEPIDDWSFVFLPPPICPYVGSSKYAPLPSLPSQQVMPPIPTSTVAGLVYKSTRQKQKEQAAAPSSTGGSGPLGAGTVHPPLSSSGVGCGTGTPAGSRSIETNALLVNVLLYDTALNIFRDHNFKSCTLCVCNAGAKCVGNIRGADSGLYLALPGTNWMDSVTAAGAEPTPSTTPGPAGGRSKASALAHLGLGGSSSAFGAGMLGSPTVGRQEDKSAPVTINTDSLQNGYLDEDPIDCQCGFSAVVNRRMAHRAGLFYEDEMEITGMAEDPAVHKNGSLFEFLNGTAKAIKLEDADRGTLATSAGGSSSSAAGGDSLPLTLKVMDLLREQCSVVQSSSNSIHRAVNRYRGPLFGRGAENGAVHLLEYVDANDVISLALEQGRLQAINESKMDVDQQQQQQQQSSSGALVKGGTLRGQMNVHKWPFLRAGGPKSNQDIVRIMKSMQPLLQDAFHKRCTTRLWDAPYTIQGPLTWRQFHRLAGRGTGQCEPQPIPSLIVGYEKDWLSLAPYALHYWDKLLLEPYSYPRDVAYVAIVPDNDYVVAKVRTYFKELSTTYEMCKLGRHTPIKGWDGILRVGSQRVLKETQNSNLDEWFTNMGVDQQRKNGTTTAGSASSSSSSGLNELLRLYAQTCQQQLAPYLSKVPSDKSLLDPPESHHHTSSSASASASLGGGAAGASSLGGGSMGQPGGNAMGQNRPDGPGQSPMPPPPPSTPDSSQPGDKAPNTPKFDHDSENRDQLNTSSASPADGMRIDDDGKDPPHIVLYIVEPFTCGNDSPDVERLACLSLLRCYSNILNAVPDSIRSNISVQIISLESILELGRNRNRLRLSDHMRCLALSVFSQSRKYLAHMNTVKSLTGFGTAANAEQFIKRKDDKNRVPYRLYTPPYVLARSCEKSENTESFGKTSMKQQCSIMYCSYCLSEDQSWLLAVATDDRGEFLETVTINIDIPNRGRRKRASARRYGLQKLMDFILGLISQTVQPWRLVVGRIGRIGHGELKGWSWLLSKPNLQRASKHLKDICEQCSLMHPIAVPSILSACLVTLEPDSDLRVMSDQFTPDERFSQRSMQSPLSTPQDATCTHILVFPTSAKAQSAQASFSVIGELDLGEDLNMVIMDGDDDDDGINMMDVFKCWDDLPMQQINMPHSRPGSPSQFEGNQQSPGESGSKGAGSRDGYGSQDSEEVGLVLQQPLAIGYLVSTAPTGRMPEWFWSSCPHMENVCPVFLRTALHLHSPTILQNTDDPLQQNQSSTEHPLDSNITADVLRYVLEGYNLLSWLAMDSNTHDRLSCLPIHVQVLMQLYHMTAALA